MAENIVDKVDEDYIEILLCRSYGGWNLNEFVKDLYLTRKREIEPNYNFKYGECWDYYIDRHDPILLDIYHEYKNTDKLNTKYCKLDTCLIQKKYINHYRVTEYDGLESFEIKYEKYLTDKIQEILANNELTDSEKIQEIRTLVGSY